jgi:putative two-component system response regulator
VQFGGYLQLSADELDVLQRGSLLHDIGKVSVPDHILLKPDRLTPEETEIMREHPVVGEKICAPLKSFRYVLPLIRHHHERADGSGYPDGLRGDEIPLTAQILQMADIYDALTTDRPYRKAMPIGDALTIMKREARTGLLSGTLCQEFSIFVGAQRPWRKFGNSMPDNSRIH